MRDSFNIRRYPLPVGLLVAFLFISSFCCGVTPFVESLSECYISTTLFGENGLLLKPWFSVLLGTCAIAGIAMMIYSFISSFSAGINFVVPIAFAAFALFDPRMIFFTDIHAAAILRMGAAVMSIRFVTEARNNDDIFISMFLLSCASLFFEPLLWLAPAMVLANLREDAIKIIATALTGLAVPLVLVASVLYIFKGAEPAIAALTAYGEALVTPEFGMAEVNATSLFRITLMALVVIAACATFLRHINTSSIVRFRALVRVIIYMVATIAVLLIFGMDHMPRIRLLLCIPSSILIFEYISTEASRKVGSRIVALLLIALIVERIQFFL